MDKRIFGLVGFPLGHSFSKDYFNRKWEKAGLEDLEYRNFSLASIDDLPDKVLSVEGLVGFNVTVPYKEAIVPMIDKVSEVANEIGAVNCVKIVEGKTYGYNTDAFGFKRAFGTLGSGNKPCLVLGTGGASKAVQFGLKELGIDFKVVSRKEGLGDLSFSDIDAKVLSEYPVIVQCTPLGMSPNIDSFPNIPYDLLTSKNYAFDLIYNPGTTLFLSKCAEMECKTLNGMSMLAVQADKSWEIWNEG